MLDPKAGCYHLRLPGHGQHVYGPIDSADSESVGIQNTKRKSSVAIDRHIFIRTQFRVSRPFHIPVTFTGLAAHTF